MNQKPADEFPFCLAGNKRNRRFLDRFHAFELGFNFYGVLLSAGLAVE